MWHRSPRKPHLAVLQYVYCSAASRREIQARLLESSMDAIILCQHIASETRRANGHATTAIHTRRATANRSDCSLRGFYFGQQEPPASLPAPVSGSAAQIHLVRLGTYSQFGCGSTCRQNARQSHVPVTYRRRHPIVKPEQEVYVGVNCGLALGARFFRWSLGSQRDRDVKSQWCGNRGGPHHQRVVQHTHRE